MAYPGYELSALSRELSRILTSILEPESGYYLAPRFRSDASIHANRIPQKVEMKLAPWGGC